MMNYNGVTKLLILLLLLVSCKSNEVVEPTGFNLNGVWQSYKDASLDGYPFYTMKLQIEGRNGIGQFSDQMYQFTTNNILYADNEQQNVSFDLVFNFFGAGEVVGQFNGNIKVVNDRNELHGHIQIPALNITCVVHLKQQGIIYLPKTSHFQGSINQGY
jgi:hypothetical protein